MSQRGTGALGMVVMLLVMGSLTLHASRERLAQSVALVADERQHIQDFWAAQSALQWGLRQRWPASQAQGCQQDRQRGWISCLQEVSDERALLNGRAAESELALWRWVAKEGSQLKPLPHGWIDYCPLATVTLCRQAARLYPAGDAAGPAAAGHER
ncbi:DUF2509 family protein [Pantoea sp. KPR_PJ]|uniref:DUF2509 family protein n=1 Tax=Pantoea sp. KPR_PJ TaxID=2738375 RepID=UPI003529134A